MIYEVRKGLLGPFSLETPALMRDSDGSSDN